MKTCRRLVLHGTLVGNHNSTGCPKSLESAKQANEGNNQLNKYQNRLSEAGFKPTASFGDKNTLGSSDHSAILMTILWATRKKKNIWCHRSLSLSPDFSGTLQGPNRTNATRPEQRRQDRQGRTRLMPFPTQAHNR